MASAKKTSKNNLIIKLAANVKKYVDDVLKSINDLIEAHWLRASRIYILFLEIKKDSITRAIAKSKKETIDKRFIVNIIYEILNKSNTNISKQTIRTDIDTIDLITPDYTDIYNSMPISYIKIIASSNISKSKKYNVLQSISKKKSVKINTIYNLIGKAIDEDPYLDRIKGYKTIIASQNEEEAEKVLHAAFKIWMGTRGNKRGTIAYDDDSKSEVFENEWDIQNPFA